MKTCKQCGIRKTDNEFHDNKKIADGKEGKCKVCRNAQKKLWKKNNPEKVKLYQKKNRKTPAQKKAHSLRKKVRQYGLSTTEYKKMVEYQKGLCVICQQPCKQNLVLSIDHDHKTGKVRGLLCNACNSGIAFFKDDINLIERAIKYLQAHP